MLICYKNKNLVFNFLEYTQKHLHLEKNIKKIIKWVFKKIRSRNFQKNFSFLYS